MWTKIVAWFSRTLLNSSINGGFLIAIIAVLAMIILPNINSISEKLGFDTKASLREKVVVEKVIADKAIEANKKLAEVNAIFEKTNENALQAVSTQNEAKETITAKAETIIAKRKNKIHVAKTKIKPTTEIAAKQPEIDPKLKMAVQLSGESLERVEASKTNSLAVWEAYCTFNKNDNCKTILEDGA
jgi:glutamyl/glutaminyl-tRNA synthetase